MGWECAALSPTAMHGVEEEVDFDALLCNLPVPHFCQPQPIVPHALWELCTYEPDLLAVASTQLEPVAELPVLKSLSSASFTKSAKSAALDTRRSCERALWHPPPWVSAPSLQCLFGLLCT